MSKFEEVQLSIILFEPDDVIRLSMGDNEVGELGDDGDIGGIFG